MFVIIPSIRKQALKYLLRGDSVTTESTLAKKRLLGDEGGAGCLGDRIDVRVVTTIQDRDYDVVNGEFASIVTGEGKFFADHRKVLRESKLIVDSIAGDTNTNRREIPRIIVPSFQATGLDGEIMVLKLPAPGLYTAQHIGSIPIPSDVSNLKWLRTKCIPRLMFMKVSSTMYVEYVILIWYSRNTLSKMPKYCQQQQQRTTEQSV